MSEDRDRTAVQETERTPGNQQEGIHTEETPPQEKAAKEEAAGQEQDKGEAEEKDSRQKKERDREAFHKDSTEKDKEPSRKGLFDRLRNLALRIYHRVKHIVEWAIGRGNIPSQLRANKADFSRSDTDLSSQKDKPSVDRAAQEKDNKEKENGRNWKELLYHGFASRILGRDVYMYVVQQNEKQDASRQEKNAKEQEKPGQAKKENAGQTDKGHMDRTEHPGSQEKAEHTENTSTYGQSKQEEKGDTQREPVEMKGKFNSLHKIITDDLEDRYTNAREAKEAYLDHYVKQLQEKLTDINQGEAVQVSASRENGKLEIRINDKQEQYGGYPSFMGCSMIRIEIDGHLNVTSAEAFVPTRQSDDGKLIGRKIDVSETLGAYIVSDLAKNFREDYNRGSESYNLAGRNEFEKTVRDAATQGRGNFTIDNIPYSISVKDNQIQISPGAGEKTFMIAMNAGSRQIEAARKAYDAKLWELQDTEKKLEEARNSYNELEAKRENLRENCSQAATKAMEEEQKYNNLRQELNQIRRQMSGKYLGYEKMGDLGQQEKEVTAAKNTAFREAKNASMEKNKAQAALDAVDHTLKQSREQIKALEQAVGSLKDGCRDAKEQYDAASLDQKETAREVYQMHTRNVTESRESSIRVFEEILPEQKNEIGGNFKLEDLNKAMEDTGRTSMEEALNAQVMDVQIEPSIEAKHETGLESQEISAEIE